jgi:hypothetical protein
MELQRLGDRDGDSSSWLGFGHPARLDLGGRTWFAGSHTLFVRRPESIASGDVDP